MAGHRRAAGSYRRAAMRGRLWEAESRRKGQPAASAREFPPRSAKFESQPIKDVEAHVRRAQLLRDEQRRRLDEGAQKVEDQVQKAYRNSELIHLGNLASARRRVSDTARRTASVEPVLVERNQ
jgi:hypothetical protein